MRRRRLSWVTLLGLVGCSSSPYAPINQVTPIKQMDAFFAYWNTPQYPAGYHPAPECRCCCAAVEPGR